MGCFVFCSNVRWCASRGLHTGSFIAYRNVRWVRRVERILFCVARRDFFRKSHQKLRATLQAAALPNPQPPTAGSFTAAAGAACSRSPLKRLNLVLRRLPSKRFGLSPKLGGVSSAATHLSYAMRIWMQSFGSSLFCRESGEGVKCSLLWLLLCRESVREAKRSCYLGWIGKLTRHRFQQNKKHAKDCILNRALVKGQGKPTIDIAAQHRR